MGILVLLAIVGVAFNILIAGRKTPREFPYEREDRLFTPAELSFLKVLEQAVGENYRIFGKVRLADVIRVKRGLSNSARQTAFNQIQSKHLDYVICDPNDLSIQFAVELDDRSHTKPKRQKRDDFVNKALAAAGVPLFRFPVKQSYSIQDIQNQLFDMQEETN